MKYLVFCVCGHTLDRHGGRGCDGEAGPCACRRDEYAALETALSQARSNPWALPLALDNASPESADT